MDQSDDSESFLKPSHSGIVGLKTSVLSANATPFHLPLSYTLPKRSSSSVGLPNLNQHSTFSQPSNFESSSQPDKPNSIKLNPFTKEFIPNQHSFKSNLNFKPENTNPPVPRYINTFPQNDNTSETISISTRSSVLDQSFQLVRSVYPQFSLNSGKDLSPTQAQALKEMKLCYVTLITSLSKPTPHQFVGKHFSKLMAKVQSHSSTLYCMAWVAKKMFVYSSNVKPINPSEPKGVANFSELILKVAGKGGSISEGLSKLVVVMAHKLGSNCGYFFAWVARLYWESENDKEADGTRPWLLGCLRQFFDIPISTNLPPLDLDVVGSFVPYLINDLCLILVSPSNTSDLLDILDLIQLLLEKFPLYVSDLTSLILKTLTRIKTTQDPETVMDKIVILLDCLKLCDNDIVVRAELARLIDRLKPIGCSLLVVDSRLVVPSELTFLLSLFAAIFKCYSLSLSIATPSLIIGRRISEPTTLAKLDHIRLVSHSMPDSDMLLERILQELEIVAIQFKNIIYQYCTSSLNLWWKAERSFLCDTISDPNLTLNLRNRSLLRLMDQLNVFVELEDPDHHFDAPLWLSSLNKVLPHLTSELHTTLSESILSPDKPFMRLRYIYIHNNDIQKRIYDLIRQHLEKGGTELIGASDLNRPLQFRQQSLARELCDELVALLYILLEKPPLMRDEDLLVLSNKAWLNEMAHINLSSHDHTHHHLNILFHLFMTIRSHHSHSSSGSQILIDIPDRLSILKSLSTSAQPDRIYNYIASDMLILIHLARYGLVGVDKISFVLTGLATELLDTTSNIIDLDGLEPGSKAGVSLTEPLSRCALLLDRILSPIITFLTMDISIGHSLNAITPLRPQLLIAILTQAISHPQFTSNPAFHTPILHATNTFLTQPFNSLLLDPACDLLVLLVIKHSTHFLFDVRRRIGSILASFLQVPRYSNHLSKHLYNKSEGKEVSIMDKVVWGLHDRDEEVRSSYWLVMARLNPFIPKPKGSNTDGFDGLPTPDLSTALDLIRSSPHTSPFYPYHFQLVFQHLGLESFLSIPQTHDDTHQENGPNCIIGLFQQCCSIPELVTPTNITSRIMLRSWVGWEMARYCLLSRLKTPLGLPGPTLVAFKDILTHFIELDLSNYTLESDSANVFLSMLTDLELLIQHAQSGLYPFKKGERVMLPDPPKASIAFFRTNKSICHSWFTSNRIDMIRLGLKLDDWPLVIRLAFLFKDEFSVQFSVKEDSNKYWWDGLMVASIACNYHYRLNEVGELMQWSGWLTQHYQSCSHSTIRIAHLIIIKYLSILIQVTPHPNLNSQLVELSQKIQLLLKESDFDGRLEPPFRVILSELEVFEEISGVSNGEVKSGELVEEKGLYPFDYHKMISDLDDLSYPPAAMDPPAHLLDQLNQFHFPTSTDLDPLDGLRLGGRANLLSHIALKSQTLKLVPTLNDELVGSVVKHGLGMGTSYFGYGQLSLDLLPVQLVSNLTKSNITHNIPSLLSGISVKLCPNSVFDSDGTLCKLGIGLLGDLIKLAESDTRSSSQIENKVTCLALDAMNRKLPYWVHSVYQAKLASSLKDPHLDLDYLNQLVLSRPNSATTPIMISSLDRSLLTTTNIDANNSGFGDSHYKGLSLVLDLHLQSRPCNISESWLAQLIETDHVIWSMGQGYSLPMPYPYHPSTSDRFSGMVVSMLTHSRHPYHAYQLGAYFQAKILHLDTLLKRDPRSGLIGYFGADGGLLDRFVTEFDERYRLSGNNREDVGDGKSPFYELVVRPCFERGKGAADLPDPEIEWASPLVKASLRSFQSELSTHINQLAQFALYFYCKRLDTPHEGEDDLSCLNALDLMLSYGHGVDQETRARLVGSGQNGLWADVIDQLVAGLGHPQQATSAVIADLLANHLYHHSNPTIMYTLVSTSIIATSQQFSANRVIPYAMDHTLQLVNTILVKLFTPTYHNNGRSVEPIIAGGLAGLELWKQYVSELLKVSKGWDEAWYHKLCQLVIDMPRYKTRLATHMDWKDHTLPQPSTTFQESYSIILGPVLEDLDRMYRSTINMESCSEWDKRFVDGYGELIRKGISELKNVDSFHRLGAGFGLLEKVHRHLNRSLMKVQQIKLDQISPYLSDSTRMAPLLIPIARSLPIHLIKLHPILTRLPTQTLPKKLKMLGSNGKWYPFLLKGNEDLHLDRLMLQLFGTVNRALNKDKRLRSNKVAMKSYLVVPLGDRGGLIQWLDGGVPLHSLYRHHLQTELTYSTIQDQLTNPGASHGNGGTSHLLVSNKSNGIKPNSKDKEPSPEPEPNKVKSSNLMYWDTAKSILQQNQLPPTLPKPQWPPNIKPEIFCYLLSSTSNRILLDQLMGFYTTHLEFIAKRRMLCDSLAVNCMVGYLLGIGDRHLDNLLLDLNEGTVVGIDFNVSVGRGRFLPSPETVPFRLTQNFQRLTGASSIDDIQCTSFVNTCSDILKAVTKCGSNELTKRVQVGSRYDITTNWLRDDPRLKDGVNRIDMVIGQLNLVRYELGLMKDLMAYQFQEIRVITTELVGYYKEMIACHVPDVNKQTDLTMTSNDVTTLITLSKQFMQHVPVIQNLIIQLNQILQPAINLIKRACITDQHTTTYKILMTLSNKSTFGDESGGLIRSILNFVRYLSDLDTQFNQLNIFCLELQKFEDSNTNWTSIIQQATNLTKLIQSVTSALSLSFKLKFPKSITILNQCIPFSNSTSSLEQDDNESGGMLKYAKQRPRWVKDLVNEEFLRGVGKELGGRIDRLETEMEMNNKVMELITQATNQSNLADMYEGWSAWV